MEGLYEQLKHRIEELREISQDRYFTEYLQKLNNRLIQEKYQLDLIKSELDRSYQLYLQRAEATRKQQETVSDAEQVQTETEVAFETVQTPEAQIEQMMQEVPRPQAAMSSPYENIARQAAGYRTDPIQPKKKKSGEFTVGIGVFSFVGVFFVLAAFVMLGMYFMNGLLKGMLLYAIALVVWVVSELLVRRKSQTLSVILSSIGISGLYIATLVNYLYLENFNVLVAGIALVAVTLLVFLVNRKKTLGIIQMASVAISTWVLMINNAITKGTGIEGHEIYLVIYFVLSMILIEAILWRMSKKQGTNWVLYTVFGISMATCAIGCNSVLSGPVTVLSLRTVILLAVVALGTVFYWLMRENKAKWAQLFFVYGMALLLYIFHGVCIETAIVVALLLFFVKLLPESVPVKICNAGITVIAAVYAAGTGGEPGSYLVLGSILLTIVLIRYWKTFYEVLITATTILVVLLEMDNVLALSVALAVLWLSVVLFNQIQRFRGKYLVIYNIFALVASTLCYLRVNSEDYSEIRIMYLILAVLGVGIISFILQERNKMAGARGIVIVSFLTYMVLVSHFTYDITASVMLMIIGLISIGTGFAVLDKKLRIYGLVLSMLVCFKITLFDFRGEEILQKMLLFLAAGVVSLIISGIYVILDKKYNK